MVGKTKVFYVARLFNTKLLTTDGSGDEGVESKNVASSVDRPASEDAVSARTFHDGT